MTAMAFVSDGEYGQPARSGALKGVLVAMILAFVSEV